MRSLSNLIKSSQCDNAKNYCIPIKSKKTEVPKGESKPFGDDEILYSAYEQAKDIIEEANKSGQDLIEQKMEQFKKECSRSEEAARQKGYEEGFSEGLTAGRETGYQEGILQTKKDNEKLVEGLLNLIARLEESKNQVIEKQHNNLTVLAVSIAERILNQTLKEDGTKMCTMIEQTLEQYQHQEWLNCYFSYGIFDALKNNDPEFMEKSEQASKGIRFLPSKELEDTDCIIELPTEVIDISIDTQLNKIKKVLQK